MATIVCIVSINILYGVIIGYGLSLLQLVYKLNDFKIQTKQENGVLKVELHGAMTFLTLPKLSKQIDEKLAVHSGNVEVDTRQVSFMDSASHEYLDVLNKNVGEKLKMVRH